MRQNGATVFVIDDDASVRAALDGLLRSVGLEVRSFASPREFLESGRPDGPGCLVLDVRMPGVSGLDFQGELAKLDIHIPIIFITGHGDIPMSVRAMKAGAIEFLTKPFREQELLDAIYLGISQDKARRQEAEQLSIIKARYDALNAREQSVMTQVVGGRLNKQIAADLHLSEITVKVYRASLMRKMQVKSLADLVKVAETLRLSGHKDR